MKKPVKKFLLRFCFLLYCGLMLWLLFGRSRSTGTGDYFQQVRQNMNLTPLHTVKLYLSLLQNPESTYLFRHAVVNLAGNVAMFVPLGAFLPAVFPKLCRFWKCMLCAAFLICLVELTQLFSLLGSCDIDDLLLNLLGVAIGYFFYFLLRPRKHK